MIQSVQQPEKHAVTIICILPSSDQSPCDPLASTSSQSNDPMTSGWKHTPIEDFPNDLFF